MTSLTNAPNVKIDQGRCGAQGVWASSEAGGQLTPSGCEKTMSASALQREETVKRLQTGARRRYLVWRLAAGLKANQSTAQSKSVHADRIKRSVNY